MVVIAECQELTTGELCPVVDDDGIWDSEPVDDIRKEQHCLLGFDLGDWTSLDPFGEFVDGYEQMGIAPGCLLQRPNLVQPHTANGHVIGMVWRAWAGRCVYRA